METEKITFEQAQKVIKLLKLENKKKNTLIKNLEKQIKGLEQKINILLLKCPLC